MKHSLSHICLVAPSYCSYGLVGKILQDSRFVNMPIEFPVMWTWTLNPRALIAVATTTYLAYAMASLSKAGHAWGHTPKMTKPARTCAHVFITRDYVTDSHCVIAIVSIGQRLLCVFSACILPSVCPLAIITCPFIAELSCVLGCHVGFVSVRERERENKRPPVLRITHA